MQPRAMGENSDGFLRGSQPFMWLGFAVLGFLVYKNINK